MDKILHMHIAITANNTHITIQNCCSVPLIPPLCLKYDGNQLLL